MRDFLNNSFVHSERLNRVSMVKPSALNDRCNQQAARHRSPQYRLYCLTKQSLRFVVGMLSITWIKIILSSCIKRVSHGGTVRNSIPFENVSKPIPVVLVTLRCAEGAHVW